MIFKNRILCREEEVLARYDFSNEGVCRSAWNEVYRVGGGMGEKGKNQPAGCCETDEECFFIHEFILNTTENLELVMAICQYYGGVLGYWNERHRKPLRIRTYVPQKITKKSGGCYIATACYGSYDCVQVLTFRNFRDEYLIQTFAGRLFIKTYYALSPPIAKWLKNKDSINTFVREKLLDRLYDFLKKKY